MRSLSIWEKFILLLVVINIPGVLITTFYYFSIEYVPSFDFTSLLYLFVVMGGVSLIPVTVFFVLLAWPALIFSEKWNNLKSKNVFFRRSRFNYFFVWFFSINIGVFSVLSVSYFVLEIDGFRSSFVFAFLNGLSLYFIFNSRGMSSFKTVGLSFFSVFLYFNAFSLFIILNGNYSGIPGVKTVGFKLMVGVFYLVSFFSFAVLTTAQEKKKDRVSLAIMLYIVCIFYYVFVYGSFNNFIAKRFLATENIQVVSQDRNGCKIFIGGGTVEDGACLASEVNLLSNLGDYYLFEKDGARYEVMKEKGIRLIFPAESESEPEAKPESDNTSPTEDKEKDAK